jgi:hypothetical protein
LGEVATGVAALTIYATTPVLDFAFPPSLRQGQTGLVQITGSFTSFTNSSVVSFCPGVTVVPGSVLAAALGLSLTAEVTVSATAAVGPCTVSVGTAPPLPASIFSVTSDAATGGTFAYTANSGGADLSAYGSAPGTGPLIALSDSPYGAGNNPRKVVASPSGYSVYAVNEGD